MRRLLTLVVFLGLPAIFADGQASQTSRKPLFTDYPPHLCVGNGFVAMAGIGIRNPLIVITVDVNGIEAPQTIPSVGDEIFGMQCSAGHIELLVSDYKSHRLIMPLYAVRQHSQETTIEEVQREELNLPTSGFSPPAVEHRKDSFHRIGSRAGEGMRGDWYVEVAYGNRPKNMYEVHFVSDHGETYDNVVVTLLEETLDRKVSRSVPLVHIEADHD